MPQLSAGVILYRFRDRVPEVLLVHPGGPFWARRDAGVWSIPKGEPGEGEDLLDAAVREFREETGLSVAGAFLPLTPVRQKSGKVIHAWAIAGDCDPGEIHGNSFEMEWPPKSGRMCTFPEVDRGAFFTLEEAERRILPGQRPLIAELRKLLETP